MRTTLLSSLWFVSLGAIALTGCSSAVDPTPVAESASECAEAPNLGTDVAAPAPEPGGRMGSLIAIGEVLPDVGPLAEDALILPRDLGFACELGPDCVSGQCFDGVCCDMSCGGVCEACNLEGAVGFCIAHAAGSDPEMGCGEPACYGGTAEAFSCNGTGACQVQLSPCDPYVCGASGCLDTCRYDADCAERAHCVAGLCVPN